MDNGKSGRLMDLAWHQDVFKCESMDFYTHILKYTFYQYRESGNPIKNVLILFITYVGDIHIDEFRYA